MANERGTQDQLEAFADFLQLQHAQPNIYNIVGRGSDASIAFCAFFELYNI